MKEPKPNLNKMLWVVCLAGPSSWVLVSLAAWFVSRGTDGGWAAMGMWFTGLGLILLVHVVSPIVLLVVAVRRFRAREPIGKAIAIGLSYYGLLALITIALMGLDHLIKDSAVILEALFRKK